MSAPSPPDPPSTTATTTATTTTGTTTRLFSNPLPPQRDPSRPLPQPLHSHHPNSFQRQNHHHHHPLHANQTNPRLHPLQQQPNRPQIHQDQGILYPLASSGRGFLPRPISHHNHNHSNNHNHHHHHTPADQSVAIPNSSARSNPTLYPYQVRPYGFPHLDPSNQAMHLVRPPTTHLQQSLLGTGGTVPNIVRGAHLSTNPKVAPPSSVSECNGIKDIRERSSDDNFAIIRDRKVKLSEDSSLYSLCRSWVKNSVSEENEPQYTDFVKSLPKPLPAPVPDVRVKKEDDKEENVEDVENLSPKELLQVHIKRAKKVRSRLREERLQRIARYKDRLALLLPPIVEQQFKNDSASAN